MKRYADFLTELFDTPSPYQWYLTPESGQEARFTLEDMEYFVSFEYYEKGVYNLVFGVEEETVARKFGGGRDPYAVNNFGILGTGKSYDVFSTVIAVLKDFLVKRHPQVVFFSAEEPSRRKLYDRLIALVSSKISGYKGRKEMDRKTRQHLGIEHEALYVIERGS